MLSVIAAWVNASIILDVADPDYAGRCAKVLA